MSADGAKVATGASDGIGRVWDVAGQRLVAEFKGHGGGISAITFDTDGKRVATGSDDATARVWSAANGEQIQVLAPHPARVTSVDFDRAGNRLATGAGTTARIWDVTTGKLLSTFRGHSGSVLAVAFSPDGQRLASASRDSTVRVWQAETEPVVLRAPGGAVTSIAFSGNGLRVVGGSSEGLLHIWDIASGKLLASLKMHTESISGVAIAARGGQLVTGSYDARARITTSFSDAASLVGRARRDVPRCLTPTQLAKFHLASVPPRWCIAGPGREHEKDAAQWEPRWPYHTPEWRQWQQARDKGEKVDPPDM